jgi:hypothetical protein
MSLAMRQEHAKQFPHEADVGARCTSDTRLVAFATAVDPETVPPCETALIVCAAPDDRLYQGSRRR